jgi:hypothetical protein
MSVYFYSFIIHQVNLSRDLIYMTTCKYPIFFCLRIRQDIVIKFSLECQPFFHFFNQEHCQARVYLASDNRFP